MGWLDDLMRAVGPDRLFASDEEKAQQDGEYEAEREAARRRRAKELATEAEAETDGETGDDPPAPTVSNDLLILGGLVGFSTAVIIFAMFASGG